MVYSSHRMTEQIPRIKLRDHVVERLLDMILSGNYASGARLPPERELVANFGVSRTVVREALNVLESRGLIEIAQGRGAVVTNDNARALREAFALLLRAQPKTLWHLLETRKVLEVEIAGFAAERASREDTEAMRSALDDMRVKIDLPEGFVDADVEFHTLLARSTRNPVLLTTIESVGELLRASRRVTGSNPANARRALSEHESILELVEAKDPEGARRMMRAHLIAAERDIEAATNRRTNYRAGETAR
jgi:GntR family transcriptional repressor for pyruvate dehydrogenase complex